ncbi:hypothetical protein [Kribbella jiaozuonensis]|uniref:Uncharacterized protein n=1 Tax=Kribbella jiaozuonensis TaxID=2575441 RepID=A0A4U3M2K6_9ACTN|nr:hypothetical protein [Kribbella jiaozuonensis]TKK82402.1 hypothetical protein FDA38_06340 [Kribbella jiaozuonensis]
MRPSDAESNTLGVWDSAVNGWHATAITDEPKARELASDLDIQYDAHGHPTRSGTSSHPKGSSAPPGPPATSTSGSATTANG